MVSGGTGVCYAPIGAAGEWLFAPTKPGGGQAPPGACPLSDTARRGGRRPEHVSGGTGVALLVGVSAEIRTIRL